MSIIDKQFELALRGYGITTAELCYRMPDHRCVLQTYLWQEYDIAPRFPKLHHFIAFWKEEIEGPLHSVRILGCKSLITPAELKLVDTEFYIN